MKDGEVIKLKDIYKVQVHSISLPSAGTYAISSSYRLLYKYHGQCGASSKGYGREVGFGLFLTPICSELLAFRVHHEIYYWHSDFFPYDTLRVGSVLSHVLLRRWVLCWCCIRRRSDIVCLSLRFA